MENKSNKTEAQEMMERLKHLKVETGSLICLGCENENDCDCTLHGCAVIREAAALIGKQERKINRQTNEIFARKAEYSRNRQEMVNALYLYSCHDCDCCDASNCENCKFDVPPQCRTGAETINWSYEGLKPEKEYTDDE